MSREIAVDGTLTPLRFRYAWRYSNFQIQAAMYG
jgi:hypothetical protein